MATIFVEIPVVGKKNKESISQPLYWYDSISKKMCVFNGGKLDFEYREDEYLKKMSEEEKKSKNIKSTFRLLPKVSDLKVSNINTSKNKSLLEKWFRDYVNYNHTEASIIDSDEDGMTFDVPDSEMDDFLYQIERSGFRGYSA